MPISLGSHRLKNAVIAAVIVFCTLAPEALAQTQKGPLRGPMAPEDRMPINERIRHLQGVAESDAPPRERDHAFLRVIGLLRGLRDRDGAEGWRARRNLFVHEQAMAILQSYANGLPSPPPVCDPMAPQRGAGLCNIGLRDLQKGWEFGILAEDAEQRSDFDRAIEWRRAEIQFQQGPNPDPSHWLGLADKAASWGRYEAALALCGIVVHEAAYANRKRDGERCDADHRFAIGDFEPWLAFYGERVTGPDGLDPELPFLNCVATAHLRRVSAARACDWAQQSIGAYGQRLEQTAAEALPDQRHLTRMRDAWNQTARALNNALDVCSALARGRTEVAARACSEPDGVPWPGFRRSQDAARKFMEQVQANGN